MFTKALNSIQSNEINDVLSSWRAKAVTIILYVIVAIALPAVITTTFNIIQVGVWQYLVVLYVVYLALIAVAILRKMDYRKRGYVILAAGYVMAIVNFIGFGMDGSGRVYLLALPILGFILIGIRTGWITTGLSALIYGIFWIFASTGILVSWLSPYPGPVDMLTWLTRGITLMMMTVIIVALLIRMYRFLINTLKAERKLSRELVQTYEKTLEGWARALELRDIETAGHCHRVSEITQRLARETGMANGEIMDLHRGSLLHDIGKMGIPDSILLKPGKLTDEEFKQMQQHTTYAYNLLSRIPYLSKALDIPYSHHEKWDGAGYPQGLKGNQIPFSARVFAVVDVYDALISDRPYRKAWTKEEALIYIKERACTEFDPVVVKAFVKMMEEEPGSSSLET